MANLSVRRIDEETYKRLRVQAAEHGISMEEEVRQILAKAMAAPRDLGDLALKLFGPEHGVELDIPIRDAHDPIGLDE